MFIILTQDLLFNLRCIFIGVNFCEVVKTVVFTTSQKNGQGPLLTFQDSCGFPKEL